MPLASLPDGLTATVHGRLPALTGVQIGWR